MQINREGEGGREKERRSEGGGRVAGREGRREGGRGQASEIWGISAHEMPVNLSTRIHPRISIQSIIKNKTVCEFWPSQFRLSALSFFFCVFFTLFRHICAKWRSANHPSVQQTCLAVIILRGGWGLCVGGRGSVIRDRWLSNYVDDTASNDRRNTSTQQKGPGIMFPRLANSICVLMVHVNISSCLQEKSFE